MRVGSLFSGIGGKRPRVIGFDYLNLLVTGDVCGMLASESGGTASCNHLVFVLPEEPDEEVKREDVL